MQRHQWLLSWCPYNILPPPPPAHLSQTPRKPRFLSVSASTTIVSETLSARERRQMRNERRESKLTGTGWREQVEDKLLVKPKKRYKSWTEELNLDTLSDLGPQWWIIRVSRISGQETAERVARALIRKFPEIEFKVYAPAVHIKRKLKNGTISNKPKPIFPGCVFLNCVLNKDVHDFIRECEGVGGFIGSKVGNTKKQINKPRPVSADDIEAIFRQAKEEQEKTDRAWEEEQERERILNEEQLKKSSEVDSKEVKVISKSKKRSKKASEALVTGKKDKLLVPGATVRVLSGSFAEFKGALKKLDQKTGMVTVGFTLFGKETLADLNVSEVVVETE
ncbi:hypothetical protein DCAR_0311827 [Daucus carota subsp. sativus]|uniref:NusG-like N-terminal domain-containing protein n=2 Tax=Daucus carota subsp. sativus TaxID=79200 RepID=A0AAF0WME0_DAUCS|nr:hypothetical protein DCAR_0311827 [Daucus carota subsp. sativus]